MLRFKLSCCGAVWIKGPKWCGKWAAIEVKLSSEESVEEAARHLKTLAGNVVGRGPEFLMVLTATGAAYQREDGVFVVPLGCLEL